MKRTLPNTILVLAHDERLSTSPTTRKTRPFLTLGGIFNRPRRFFHDLLHNDTQAELALDDDPSPLSLTGKPRTLEDFMLIVDDDESLITVEASQQDGDTDISGPAKVTIQLRLNVQPAIGRFMMITFLVKLFGLSDKEDEGDDPEQAILMEEYSPKGSIDILGDTATVTYEKQHSLSLTGGVQWQPAQLSGSLGTTTTQGIQKSDCANCSGIYIAGQGIFRWILKDFRAVGLGIRGNDMCPAAITLRIPRQSLNKVKVAMKITCKFRRGHDEGTSLGRAHEFPRDGFRPITFDLRGKLGKSLDTPAEGQIEMQTGSGHT